MIKCFCSMEGCGQESHPDLQIEDHETLTSFTVCEDCYFALTGERVAPAVIMELPKNPRKGKELMKLWVTPTEKIHLGKTIPQTGIIVKKALERGDLQ